MTENELNDNFLESAVVNEMLQNINVLDEKCKSSTGEEIVEMRIKQLAYYKILCNVYDKDITFLIKGYTNLAISYLDISYFEQAQEHILKALQLYENINDDLGISTKEYQIKILIILAKCYMENNKLTAALAICQKCLKMNQTLLGEDHVSNGDIIYVLAKINTKMKNYRISIENLSSMFEIYEKMYGFESEKSAKICMELAQIYELQDQINDAIEYYKNSYSIFEKIITDSSQNEIFITIAIKLAELFEKQENYQNSYEILKITEDKYGNCLNERKKKKVNFKKLLIKYSSLNQDLNNYLQALLDLEKILIDNNGEFNKSLAKTCISIATTYFQLDKKAESLEYFEKAEKIFLMYGNNNVAKEIKQRKEQLLLNK